MQLAASITTPDKSCDRNDTDSSVRHFLHYSIEQAITHKNEIMPLLIAEFVPAEKRVKQIAADPNYLDHINALYLLAQLKDPQAYPVIVDFFSVPGEEILEISGDLITEDLGFILASVCDGDLSLIKQVIENEAVNLQVRGAGFRALNTLVLDETISSQSLLAYVSKLFPTLSPEMQTLCTSLVNNRL